MTDGDDVVRWYEFAVKHRHMVPPLILSASALVLEGGSSLALVERLRGQPSARAAREFSLLYAMQSRHGRS